MASKFQNRLTGTIVLVALGVIILPGLLDGQKKHYQDEFAAIPLVPKPGDRDEPDMLPAASVRDASASKTDAAGRCCPNGQSLRGAARCAEKCGQGE